jgi:hypothetical protein
MAFGKRIRIPEEATGETVAFVAEQGVAIAPDVENRVQKPDEAPSNDSVCEAAHEFMDVLAEAFQSPTPYARRFVHLNTVIAVAAAVLGQMAVRKVFTDRALDSMRPELPRGAADGPIFADGAGETIFHSILLAARNRLSAESLPKPYLIAQRLLASDGLSLSPAHLPYIHPLKILPHYDAVALAIAERAGLDRKGAMMMATQCLTLLLQEEKDNQQLASLIRLALEVTLFAGRINPRKRDDGMDRF